MVTGTNYDYNVGRDSVQVGEFNMIGIDWSQVRVVSTTSKIPAVFTNINQIVILETVLPLSKEQKEDWTRRASPETIAIVEGVVAAINAKLGKAAEIKPEELKAAIGAKLQAAEASKETTK